MPSLLLCVMLVFSALFMKTLPVEAQATDPARTFRRGLTTVTVFDSTGVASPQQVISFPIGAGEAVELINIPVDVKAPGRHRSFLVLQFVGHFFLPSAPVTITLDCVINHELKVENGCGITPGADFDFSAVPTPRAGHWQTLIPATFIIRDLPDGAYTIGVRVEAATSQQSVPDGSFLRATSSLIVSLYSD